MSEMNSQENNKEEMKNGQTEPEQADTQQEEEKNVDRMIDETEKQSLYELSTLKEANNEANEKIIDDAQADIKKIFADLKLWLKQNSDPDAIKANLEKAKDQTIEVLNNARDKAIEVSESAEFKKTLEAGKDFLKGTGTLLGESFKELKNVLSQNPSIKKVFDKTDEQIDKLRANENLKDAFGQMHEAANKFNNAVFEGINKFFRPKETPAAPKEIETKVADKPEDHE